MKFIVDAQLPPALARYLVSVGYDADHVCDVGLLAANDGAIWMYALNTGAIIITKDEDFAERLSLAKEAPIVVWLRLGNSTKRALLLWFRNLLPEIISKLEAGETLVEVV